MNIYYLVDKNIYLITLNAPNKLYNITNRVCNKTRVVINIR